uniref:Pentacotripeptide-repeat region of PRORP domain-containing protein n=1 Tax=Cucumis sativus TaxID=3659 RepID=A0A0A0L8E8_CUCSA
MNFTSLASKRSISSLHPLSTRIKQTENEIVQMFRVSTPSPEASNFSFNRKVLRRDPSVRTLDERFIRILKIFKWGSDAEKAIEVLKLKVDHRAGRLEDALKLFGKMDSLQCAPNVVTYNTVIKAIFESKAPASEAALWFEKMKANGIAPSSFTYAILIDGFCKTNRVEKALLLLEEMDEKGFPPCPAAYCSLIDSLGRAKRYEAANELFQELKENCGRSSARTGGPKRAIEMFTKMKESEIMPDAVSYNTILSCLSRAGMFEMAAKLMREMKLKGFEYDSITYSSILEAVGKVDEDCSPTA